MELGLEVRGAKVQTIFFEAPNKHSSRREMLCPQYFSQQIVSGRLLLVIMSG